MLISEEWRNAIDEYLTAQRAAGAPATTCTTRRGHLEHAARRLGGSPWTLTGRELVDWCGTQEWARETRRGRRSTFRSFWGWAVKSGRTEDNPALELPRVPATIPAARPTPDRVYKEAMIAARGRDRLILRLAAEIGLRRAEIAQMHSRDLVEDLLGWSLVVHGKGGKERTVPLPDGLARALRDCGEGWIFPGDDHGHLSPRWVGKIATRLLDGPWTLHTLRHRFATLAYDVDRDVFVVQELLGHSSPATTRRYVQTRRDNLRRTVAAVAS